MNKLPLLRLIFEDNSKEIEIDDKYIVKDSIEFDYVILSNLEPSSNKVKLDITKHCPYIEEIINSKKDIKAILLLKEGDVYKTVFTGYVSNKFKWKVSTAGESGLKIQLEDVGTKVLNKNWDGGENQYLSGKLTDVVNEICKQAGIERGDDLVVDNEVACVLKKDEKFKSILNSLVTEYFYTYYFDAFGKLRLTPIKYIDKKDPKAPDYVIDKSSLYTVKGEALSINKSVKQFGKVDVKWEEYVSLTNSPCYEDISGRDEEHPHCMIEVNPHAVYPPVQIEEKIVKYYPDEESMNNDYDNQDIKDGQIVAVLTSVKELKLFTKNEKIGKFVYSSSISRVYNTEVTDLRTGRDVINVSNIKPRFNVAYSKLEPEITLKDGQTLSVFFYNSSESVVQINELACDGDLIVKGAEGHSRNGVDGETKKITAKWIHDQIAGDNYAALLANYYEHCNHTYTFYTSNNMELNTICNLKDETFSNLNTTVLLTSKKWKLEGIYEYKAVAMDIFDIDIKEGSVITPGSGIVGPPGPQGNGIKDIITYYAKSNSSSIAPSKWNTVRPVLTPEERFLWSYTETVYTDGKRVVTEPGIVASLGIDGKAPVLASPSNYNFLLQSSETGEVAISEFEKIGTEITVTQDSQPLIYQGTEAKGTYEVRLTQTDIDKLSVVKQGDNAVIKGTKDTVLLADNASAEVVVSYKDFYERVGDIRFTINFAKVKQGEQGQYTAFQYYLSTSEKEPIDGTWSNDPINVADGKFLWMRTQIVPAGGTIDDTKWGTPVLTGTDISKVINDIKVVDGKVTSNTTAITANAESINSTVAKQEIIDNKVDAQSTKIDQTADQIFLSVNRETNEVSNSAGIKVGWLSDDKTQIQLDADYILLDGSVKADKIDTTDLLAKEITVKDQGSIRSEVYIPEGDDPQGFELNHDGTATFLGMTARSGHFQNITIDGKSTFSGDINSSYFEVRNQGLEGSAISADSSGVTPTGWTDKDIYDKMYPPTPWLISKTTEGSTYDGTSVTLVGLFDSGRLGQTRTICSGGSTTTGTVDRKGTYRVNTDETTYDWSKNGWVEIRRITKVSSTKPSRTPAPLSPSLGDTYSSAVGMFKPEPDTGDYIYDYVTWRYEVVETGTSTSDVYVIANGRQIGALTSGYSKSFTLNAGDEVEIRYSSIDSGTPRSSLYELYSDNWHQGINFANTNGVVYWAYQDTSIRSQWFNVNGNTPSNTGSYRHLEGIYQGGYKLTYNQVLDFKTPNTTPASSYWPTFNCQLQSGSNNKRFNRLIVYRSNGNTYYKFEGPDGTYDTKDIWFSSYSITNATPFSTPAGVYIRKGALRGDTEGTHIGNVNSQGTTYKVWGAVAN